MTDERRFRELDKEILKQAMKEAVHEWLEEKFAQFGRWTFFGISAAALGGVTYFIGWLQWHKLP